jgi:hypothetical protein
MALSLSGLAAAQFWNALAVAALVGFAAASTWRATRRPALTVYAAILVSVAGVMLENARFALTDTVFLAVLAAFVYLIAAALDGARTAVWLLPVMTVAAAMLRWVGIVFAIPAALACAFGLPPRAAAKRAGLQIGLPVLCLAILPMLGGGAPRTIAWHPTISTADAVRAIGSWLAPRTSTAAVQMTLGAGLLILFGVATMQAVRRRISRFSSVLVAGLSAYAAALVGSRTLLDASIPWDDRILAPLTFLGVVLGCALLAETKGAIRGLVIAPLILFGVAQVTAWPHLLEQSAFPQGYTSVRWEHMPMSVIDTRLAHYEVLASNYPDVVWLWAHRSSLTIPERTDPLTLHPNPALTAQLNELSNTLAHQGAVVFYDDPLNPRSYLVPEASLVRALRLHLVEGFPGARIYAR